MRVFFLRHGETELNRTDRLQGRIDEPLNDAGRRQALLCRERMTAAGLRFDRIWSSPLRRAVETAVLATGAAPEAIRREERLTEFGYGPWEGMPFTDLKEDVLPFLRDPDHVPAPEGMESIPALMARTGAFLRDLALSPGDDLLVVTHGVVIRAILGHLRGQPDRAVWSLPVDNCVLYETHWENGRFTAAARRELG